MGAVVYSKGPVAKVDELLCKVLCHKICYVIQSMCELGIQPQFQAPWPQFDGQPFGVTS